MNEKVIQKGIKEKLGKEIPDYATKDFPVDITSYSPIHPKGELLIKSAGFRAVKYVDRQNQMDILRVGNFTIMEYQWRVDLAVRDIRSTEPIYDLTDLAIESMKQVVLDSDGQTEEWGTFYLSDASEPDFDYEKKYQFRTLLFAIQVLQFNG